MIDLEKNKPQLQSTTFVPPERLSVECQTSAAPETTTASGPPAVVERQEPPVVAVDDTRVHELGRKIANFAGRLDSIEDEIDEFQTKHEALHTSVLGKVDVDYMARIKSDIYSEFARIHATIVSLSTTIHVPEILKPESRTTSPPKENAPLVAERYDDTAIKHALDEQAVLIADLCKRQSVVQEVPTAQQPTTPRTNGSSEMSTRGLQDKLESVSDRVGEMFARIQAQHNAAIRGSTTRNVIPIANQSYLISTLMTKVEEKLDAMRDVTGDEMQRMRSQLHRVLKKKIKKAMDQHSSAVAENAETAIGMTKCLTCHRPVDRVAPNKELLEAAPDGDPVPVLGPPALDSRFETVAHDNRGLGGGEKDYVYRGGFRMPVSSNDK